MAQRAGPQVRSVWTEDTSDVTGRCGKGLVFIVINVLCCPLVYLWYLMGTETDRYELPEETDTAESFNTMSIYLNDSLE